MHEAHSAKYILLFIALFSVAPVFSQAPKKAPVIPKIAFNGMTNVPGVVIKIKAKSIKMENGKVKSDRWVYSSQTYSQPDGIFFFQLKAHSDNENNYVNYLIEFSRTGYQPKKLLFNTYIPAEDYNDYPFQEYNFDMDVTMTADMDSASDALVEWDSKKKAFVVTRLEREAVKIPAADSVGADTLIRNELPAGKKISISGHLYANDQNSALENAKVNLLNSKNEVVRTTTTNSLGSFTFINLPEDETYTIAVVSVPPKVAVKKTVLTTRDGQKIAESEGKMLRYTFPKDKKAMHQLAAAVDKLTASIKGKLVLDKEKQTPAQNAQIVLKNGKGEIVANLVTDSNGKFQMENLPADQSYALSLNEKDSTLYKKEVFLEDSEGNVLKRMKTKDDRYFHFEFLPPDQNGLTTISYDDPWLQVPAGKGQPNLEGLVITESIYYDFGKWEILPQAAILLNKAVDAMKRNPAISVEIVSHTDSRGETDFNLELSKKRAAAAVAYIISRGIAKDRISGTGMGEQNLMNRCKDGVDCSEEEHSQNRRTEFRIKS